MADLDDLLVKTSRTFALSIPVLPEPTRSEVTISYLLFRIADTFEDASHWEAQFRIEALERFVELLRAENDDDGAQDVERWLSLSPSAHDGYIELLAEVPAVLEAFRALAPRAQAEIRRRTIQSSQGMVEYVNRTAAGGLQLRDLADLRHYCYVVAGLVGELLTELFLLGRESLEPVADCLRQRSRSFGEALQLVNILKDSADDALEGRRYLPVGVPRDEVFRLARRDLDSSTEYVRVLERASAPRGLVAFTALPVLLARATLDRVQSEGPGTKLSRPEVAGIVQQMNLSLDEDRSAVPA